ncbi:hypothetical protein [uncultured Martelella sp.]|uniref:hypothetical protein n=1 Tax=uncultured Martelella sp. TaxID=392331 RepID=UPI0029C602E9|nr:hypothetical protein [uncultured Martelella sp.]
MTAAPLPLFQTFEDRGSLRRLQKRREALLKRLHGLPPQSRKRAGLAYELSIVTTELIRFETQRDPGGRHV